MGLRGHSGRRWSLGGEGKGFCSLAWAALSCLAQNSEGSENSKMVLGLPGCYKATFAKEGGFCDSVGV